MASKIKHCTNFNTLTKNSPSCCLYTGTVMCVSTLCGKTFCIECFEQKHPCNKADIEREKSKLNNKLQISAVLPVNPFFSNTIAI